MCVCFMCVYVFSALGIPCVSREGASQPPLCGPLEQRLLVSFGDYVCVHVGTACVGLCFDFQSAVRKEQRRAWKDRLVKCCGPKPFELRPWCLLLVSTRHPSLLVSSEGCQALVVWGFSCVSSGFACLPDWDGRHSLARLTSSSSFGLCAFFFWGVPCAKAATVAASPRICIKLSKRIRKGSVCRYNSYLFPHGPVGLV